MNQFPNASRSSLELNPHLAGLQLPEHQERAGSEKGVPPAPGAKLERRAPDAAVGKAKAKGGDSRRFLVRVTSCRRRLIDEDNLCEKFVVDCCRYAGLVPSDSPSQTRIEAHQRKVGKEEEEHTLIEIFEVIANELP